MAERENQKPRTDKEVIAALCALSGLPPTQIAADLIDAGIQDARTVEKVLDSTDGVSRTTLERVAAYFNEKLPPLKLEWHPLFAPTPVLSALVVRLAPIAPPAPLAALAVHKCQNDALAALRDRPNLDRDALRATTVSVVAFTLHKFIEKVQEVFLTGLDLGGVDLYLGTEDVARDLQSTRQVQLIHQLNGEIDSELAKSNDRTSKCVAGSPRQPVRGSKINEYRYRSAPTFQGWLIPKVAVCVAPVGWFPTFHGVESNDAVAEIKERYKKKHIHTAPDEYALNGWMMPHFQAFYIPGAENRDFSALEEHFRLFIDSHRLATIAPAAPQ